MNNLVALGLDVGLCLWLIPSMGITGAAIAWAIAAATRSVLAVVQCRLALRVVSFGLPAAIVALANGVCIAAPLLLLPRLTETHLFAVAVLCVVMRPPGLVVRASPPDALGQPVRRQPRSPESSV